MLFFEINFKCYDIFDKFNDMDLDFAIEVFLFSSVYIFISRNISIASYFLLLLIVLNL